jgi:DNA-binding response OmpR family regulator
LTGQCILLVEDDEQIRKLLSAFLERRGYRVMLAVDGHDALEQVSLELPDLVISDLNMPRLNGLELLARLRQDSRTRDVPVVLLSAQRSDDDVATGLSQGADAYVPKPIEMSMLARTVEELLQRSEG